MSIPAPPPLSVAACSVFSDNQDAAQLENFRLKVFRTVAEQLSFHKAADQLFLTQPAVTLQIKALEDDLGVRLFDRSGGHVSLARQGTVLLRYAQRIASLAYDAQQELAAGQSQLGGNLALGVSTTIAQYVLPRLIAVFLAENPRVRLALRSDKTEEVVQLLLHDQVSVGLIEGPARDQGVRTEPFMEDELVLIAPPDFGSDCLSAEQLVRSSLIMREQGSGSRRVIENTLEKASVPWKSFENVMEIDSSEAIKSAVEAGLGIGFVSRGAISKELVLGTLKVVQADGVRVAAPFFPGLADGAGTAAPGQRLLHVRP